MSVDQNTFRCCHIGVRTLQFATSRTADRTIWTNKWEKIRGQFKTIVPRRNEQIFTLPISQLLLTFLFLNSFNLAQILLTSWNVRWIKMSSIGLRLLDRTEKSRYGKEVHFQFAKWHSYYRIFIILLPIEYSKSLWGDSIFRNCKHFYLTRFPKFPQR